MTKIHIYPFWHPFYPFFARGWKVLCLDYLLHKWFLNWPKSKKGPWAWIFLSQNRDEMCFWRSIFQNFTKLYFYRPKRVVSGPKIGWQREMGYFISFSSKRVKRVKGVRYIWIFWKIWILRVLDDFWPKSKFTLFGTLFTLFLPGVEKYCVWTLSSINGFKIGPKAKKGHRFENFITKLLPKMLFLANFSKFHKMVLCETGKAFCIKKGTKCKKGKRGTIYLDFGEKLNFEIFRLFLTKI